MKPVNRMAQLRHELLSGTAEECARLVREYGIDGEVADQIGHAVADYLAISWGGQLIHFPKDHHFVLARRDQEIYGKFNGHNHSLLAKEYGICVTRIYNIVKRQQQLERSAKQPDLFV